MSFTNKDLENLQFMMGLGFNTYNFDKKADGIWYLRNYKNSVQKIVIGKDKGKMDLLIEFGSYHHQYHPVCHYKTKEDIEEIFKLFRKVITNDLDRYDKEDHVTGYLNEEIHDNYRQIADSINFKPKNIDELNEYAIKLRDEGKLSFEDYVKGISSLYIILLLDVYKLPEVDFSYDKNEKYNYRYLFVKRNPQYERTDENKEQYDKEEVIIRPTLDVEKLWNDKISAITCKIFEKDDEKLDNCFINNMLGEYKKIADSINFKPKNIDELNEYAIKLRDEGKLSFEDYVKGISSLYIVLLLDVYKFDKVIYLFDPKDVLLLKVPSYVENFENSLRYRDDFTRIQIVNDVTKLYYKHRYKLGHKNLNKIKL